MDFMLSEPRRNPYKASALVYKKQGPESIYEKNLYERTSSCNVNTNFPHLRKNILSIDLSKFVEIGEIHSIPNSVKHGFKYRISNWYLRNISAIYKVEDNKGINYNDSRTRKIDICLAKYAQKVAEDMNVSSACYTGVKHALWSSGVIEDYSEMPKGSAYLASEYFDAHPEKFKKLYVQLKDLKNLPAGCIVVYKKEGLDGHIAITNGFGQEMSDCTDNMRWVERRKKGATYEVYALTDGWKYNPQTKKLEFSAENISRKEH